MLVVKLIVDNGKLLVVLFGDVASYLSFLHPLETLFRIL